MQDGSATHAAYYTSIAAKITEVKWSTDASAVITSIVPDLFNGFNGRALK